MFMEHAIFSFLASLLIVVLLIAAFLGGIYIVGKMLIKFYFTLKK